MAFKLPDYDELNITQQQIINSLAYAEKLAVVGGPGTGKTIIAIQASSIMSSSDEKCLFLTYSKPLIMQIECIAKQFGLNIENI